MATEPKTVLVVDDEPDILELISMALGLEGYHVQTASHGREALEAVSVHMPDLILLDMKMPVMDGPSFAREFQSTHNNQVPIIVVTAAADAPGRAREIGASGHLGKPFDLDELTEVVNRYLNADGFPM